MNLTRLAELAALAAPSGYEDPVIRVMLREMSKVTSEVRADRLGNVIAHLPGPVDGSRPLMVFAHMDELGFIVRKIEPNGFVRIERLGGVPVCTAQARPVQVVTSRGAVMGIVGARSHHYTRPEEKNAVVPIQDLYLDLGVSSAAEVAGMGVAIGNPVCYEPFFHVQGDRVISKSLDNRAGCEVLLEAFERVADQPRSRDVYFVASVQEEFNLRGVLATFPAIQPEIALALDVVVACDTPDLEAVSDTRLGGGPVVSLYTFHGRGTLGGLIPNPKLAAAVVDTAARHNIAIQRNVSMGLLTDASFLQMEGEGVDCIDLAFATRYTHSPVETASLSDLDQLVDLVSAFVREVPRGLDLTRG